VHRNHAFEFVQSPTQTFLAFAGLRGTWILTDYDDSLSFSSVESSMVAGRVDVELLWIDFDRYSLDSAALRGWLKERLKTLRRLSDAPILLTRPLSTDAIDPDAVSEAASSVPGVHLLAMTPIEQQLGEHFLDPLRATFQGSRLGRQAQLLLAQWLGLKWLPAVAVPRLKALAIDLDNTLYRGVLGEDGPTNIELTAGHRALQRRLVRLGEEGILLAVVSKNEMADVERMFSIRQDFPLRIEHLAGIRANWDPKAMNILGLAKEFNIAPSTFLMLDDNPGELFAAVEEISGLSILHAADDAALTAEHIERFPRLMTFGLDTTDAFRTADIRAAAGRTAIRAQRDPVDYLVGLETELHFQVRPRERYKRMCELPQKTNQFNLAMRRFREGDVLRYMEERDYCVVSIDLKDKLSNSGNVGAVYVHGDGEVLLVDELCVSCRALGRSLEDLMIGGAIEMAAHALGDGFDTVEFVYRNGPRNAPALAWLARLAPNAIIRSDEASEVAPLRSLRMPYAVVAKLLAVRTKLPPTFITTTQ
jgi:FkbH-like protein